MMYADANEDDRNGDGGSWGRVREGGGKGVAANLATTMTTTSAPTLTIPTMRTNPIDQDN